MACCKGGPTKFWGTVGAGLGTDCCTMIFPRPAFPTPVGCITETKNPSPCPPPRGRQSNSSMAGQLTNMPAEQIASIRYQLDHLSDDRRPVLIGACWALWSLAVLAMGLRFYAKSIVRSRFQLEDGLLLLGSVWRRYAATESLS